MLKPRATARRALKPRDQFLPPFVRVASRKSTREMLKVATRIVGSLISCVIVDEPKLAKGRGTRNDQSMHSDIFCHLDANISVLWNGERLFDRQIVAEGNIPLLGNHDVELAYPEVGLELMQAIIKDAPEAKDRISLFDKRTTYNPSVNGVLIHIEHGNAGEPWNASRQLEPAKTVEAAN